MTPSVVLVPGGFLGPWIWQPVQARLTAAGLPSVAVPLASVPTDPTTTPGDLYADAAAVRRVLDTLDQPVIVCGHSYGGAVITQAASGPHPAVHRLVFLAAAAPDQGQALTDLAPPPTRAAEPEDEAEEIEFRSDGTIALTAEAAKAGLFNDCDDDAADRAVARLQAMNPAVNAQPITTTPAWRQLPTSYVRCSRDHLPELLSHDFLGAVDEVVELPTGHCPQWSRPDLVAQLLIRRHPENAPP